MYTAYLAEISIVESCTQWLLMTHYLSSYTVLILLSVGLKHTKLRGRRNKSQNEALIRMHQYTNQVIGTIVWAVSPLCKCHSTNLVSVHGQHLVCSYEDKARVWVEKEGRGKLGTELLEAVAGLQTELVLQCPNS